jgi:hypothetical protein
MKQAETQSLLQRVRLLAIAVLLLLLGSQLDAQAPQDEQLASATPAVLPAGDPALKPAVHAAAIEPARTAKERFQDYRSATFSPWALFTPSLSAGLSQWRDYPSEWKQGGEGFGKRLASAYGGVAIENTISLGVTYVDHEDLRYPLSSYPRGAILKRAGHAIAYTFVPKKEEGGRRFGWSRVVGAYGAGFVANTWYPSRHSDTSNALYLGSMNLVGDLGVNLLKEFIRPHLVFGNTHNSSASKKVHANKGS